MWDYFDLKGRFFLFNSFVIAECHEVKEFFIKNSGLMENTLLPFSLENSSKDISRSIRVMQDLRVTVQLLNATVVGELRLLI